MTAAHCPVADIHTRFLCFFFNDMNQCPHHHHHHRHLVADIHTRLKNYMSQWPLPTTPTALSHSNTF